ncbi:MAG: DUF4116 domain-containing protein [Fusobacterium sp.]|nr:DUF4116 domain-containing protein [Fusobacterium sp.]
METEVFKKFETFLKNNNILKNEVITLNFLEDEVISEIYLSEFLSFKNLKDNFNRNNFIENLLNSLDSEINIKLEKIIENFKDNRLRKEDGIEYLKKNFSFNIDYKKLIENTKVKDIYISVGKEGTIDNYMSNEFFSIKNFGLRSDENIIELLDKSDISHLINSQGYKIEDFYDEEKLNTSIFLKSLKESINSSKDLIGKKLTFYFKEISLNDMLDVFSQDNLEISKESYCFLNNPVLPYDKNSNLIQLEKNIVIEKKDIIDLDISENSIGYYPRIEVKDLSKGQIKKKENISELFFNKTFNRQDVVNFIKKFLYKNPIINNKEIALVRIREDGLNNNYTSILEYVSKKLREDKEIIMEAVNLKGKALKYASDRLKDDKEVVLAAVKQNGSSLEYASERLKDDREIVNLAVKESGFALNYASQRIKDNLKLLEIGKTKKKKNPKIPKKLKEKNMGNER